MLLAFVPPAPRGGAGIATLGLTYVRGLCGPQVRHDLYAKATGNELRYVAAAGGRVNPAMPSIDGRFTRLR